MPEQELLQRSLLEHLGRAFELHGFSPLQLRSVEPLDVLLAKGETDKEIYVLRRLHAEEDEDGSGLGLHYDLTVPFARYVAQHHGRLLFPFKRYQIQPVWRGERPQLGRYREFLQVDMDVIGQGELPIRHDGEMVRLLGQILATLPIPSATLRVNNRKVLEGFYRGLGVRDVVSVLRVVDKIDKIGEAGVAEALGALGLESSSVDGALALARIEADSAVEVDERVRALGVTHELLDQGLFELREVLAACEGSRGRVRAALHVARGFDYYTGTVVEGFLDGHESLGAVCSGGRYDDLAAMGSKHRFPGVGVSIGITRLLGYLFGKELLVCKRRSPCRVLVLLPAESERGRSEAVASALRSRGIACEVYHRDAGWGKQIRHADRMGIPYVWFPASDSESHRVKNVITGDQVEADPEEWTPDGTTCALPLELEGRPLEWDPGTT